MQSLPALLIRLARRHRLQQLLTQLVPPTMISTLLAAVAVAAIRWALPELEWMVPALVVAGLAAPLVWLPSAWRVSLSTTYLAAELDQLAQAEGLVMAYAEWRDPAWQERCQAALARIRLPSLRWQAALPGLLAAMLLAGAVALPQTVPLPLPTGPADALVKPLREQLAELANAGILTAEEHHELTQRLADLIARNQGGVLDQATWEGIDRVQAQATAQASAAGEKLAAALSAAEAAASPALSTATATATATSSTDANALAAKLAVDLARLAEQAPALAQLDLADPQQRAALAAALARAQQRGLLSKAQVEALQRAGLASGHMPAAGVPTPAQGQALARQLAEALGKRQKKLSGAARTASEQFLARLRGQQLTPGNGAPTRGPGEAPLDQLPRSRTAGGEQAALAPGATLNPDGSVTIAGRSRDAELDPAAQAALQRAAAQAFDPTAADSRRATVAPRHRAAVAAYFSEPAK
jgi:hypothetical protein